MRSWTRLAMLIGVSGLTAAAAQAQMGHGGVETRDAKLVRIEATEEFAVEVIRGGELRRYHAVRRGVRPSFHGVRDGYKSRRTLERTPPQRFRATQPDAFPVASLQPKRFTAVLRATTFKNAHVNAYTLATRLRGPRVPVTHALFHRARPRLYYTHGLTRRHTALQRVRRGPRF